MLANILSKEPKHKDEASEGGERDGVAGHRDNLGAPEPESQFRFIPRFMRLTFPPEDPSTRRP